MDNGTLAFAFLGGPLKAGLIIGGICFGIPLVAVALYAFNVGLTKLIGLTVASSRARRSHAEGKCQRGLEVPIQRSRW